MENGQNTGCGTIFAIVAGIGLIISIIVGIVADLNFLDFIFS